MPNIYYMYNMQSGNMDKREMKGKQIAQMR